MYSFDIFDTLITRATAEPKGIFMLMQEIMREKGGYPPFLTENFYELRVGAEELAWRYVSSRGKREVTLSDIYKTLATITDISETDQEKLRNLEIEIEYNNILPVRKNIALLNELKEKGEHIVLISDMYLGEEDIRRILCRVDLIFEELSIYVSSVYGKSKGSGELFKAVQKYENTDFSNWIHYGDNEHADIRTAKKLGIQAVHLSPEPLKEYEYPNKDFYHQLSIGISRYVRSQERGNVASEVGSSLAGPILYPYVRWVLEESMRRGIHRLYFVARDGWILWKIADIIIEAERYPIKTLYIYGSRKAWRLPYYDGSKDDLKQILKYSNIEMVLSLKDLEKLFQIPLGKLRAFLPENWKSIDEGQEISRAQIDTIIKWLQENESFRSYLVESQKGNRALAIQYFQQELQVSDDKFAFVELSGTGFTQVCLAKILRNFYTGEVKNFFYRLDDVQEEENCKFFQFYPSNLKRYMLELLCRAPHGQTEGYKEENGKILPVLEEAEGEQIRAYHIEEYQKAVLAYVKGMEEAWMKNGLEHVQKLDLAREYLELIAEHPPKRIAEYFCHMPFSSGGRKNSMVEFSPDVSKKQLREIYFWNNGKNVRQVYHGDFIEYILKASDETARYKEKCQQFRKKGIGRLLVDWNRYLRTHQKPGMEYFCPWELLRGSIVIYGAGKVGQAFVKQTKQKYARCDSLLWVDSNFRELQLQGLQVENPEEIKNYFFDRVIIAIHNDLARQEIWDRLRNMGVETEKIYYG